TEMVDIVGGHNVVIIGGYVSVPTPAHVPKHGEAINIRIAASTGTVHVEGVLIDNSSGGQTDGVRIKAPDAILQLENMRVVGLNGALDEGHADVVQPGGGVKELRVDYMTANSNYNTMYLRRENADAPGGTIGPEIGTARFSNVNAFGSLNPSGNPPST